MTNAPRPNAFLTQRRLDLGFSRERLGAKSGLSGGTVRRIEIGEVQPYRSSLILLAQALGCTVEELIPPTNGNGPAPSESESTTHADDARDVPTA